MYNYMSNYRIGTYNDIIIYTTATGLYCLLSFVKAFNNILIITLSPNKITNI